MSQKDLYVGVDDSEYLAQYGTKRHSGRFPYGSGENPYQHEFGILGRVKSMADAGLDEKQRAKELGMNTGELRKAISLAKARKWAYNRRLAMKLKEKGMSNVAIGERLGCGESQVRNYLREEMAIRMNKTQENADILRKQVAKLKFVDVGKGVEKHLGISQTRLNTAVKQLVDEGYRVVPTTIEQLGTGKQTSLKVLVAPGVDDKEVYAAVREAKVKLPFAYSDNGESIRAVEPPKSIDSKRVFIRYGDEGGKEKDGLIELRRGVEDISLHNANYAQVRIAVDGTHYMKGMAVYSDKIPEGYDIVYNTNKKTGTPVKGVGSESAVMKPMKNDPDNPFGATILTDGEDGKLIRAQRHYIDKDGKEQLSLLNIVNEEGSWEQWHKTLASQFLGKQSSEVAKRQLGLAYSRAESEFNDLKSLTNPTVKRELLEEFARKCDKDAVDLAATAMRGQTTSAIIPFPNMKPGECYCPQYQNGTKLVLIRYPHGGIFELPVVTVNNNYKEAKDTLGNSRDAMGIHYSVAEQLSGADFDGDNVIAFPIEGSGVKTMKPLKALQEFDNKAYKLPPDAPEVEERTKNLEMGKITNLIMDMHVMGAPMDDIVRAVKHSMVVIDSAKHHLDMKASYDEFGISELNERYRGKANAGAATLLTRSTAETRVPDRKEKVLSKIKDPEELEAYSRGEKVWDYSGKTYTSAKLYKKDMTEDEKARWYDKHEEIADLKLRKAVIKKEQNDILKQAVKDGRAVYSDPKERLIKSTKMYEADDAYSLVSGSKENTTEIERVYADHANSMKALANEARALARQQEDVPYSPSAAKEYAPEVKSLNDKLNLAESNAPFERMAQEAAKLKVRLKREENPYMDEERLKRLKGQELDSARKRFGAQRLSIGTKKNPLTEREMEAINAGAISKSKLREMMRFIDSTRLKELAMPKRNGSQLSSSKLSHAKTLLNNGYTWAEIAEQIGVSESTLRKAIQ